MHRQMQACLTIIIVALTASDAATCRAESATPAKPVLRIVFFTPSDVDPPDGAKERMKQIADYTQGLNSGFVKPYQFKNGD